MARKTFSLSPSGVYMFQYIAGTIMPLMIAAQRDASGVLTAFVATRTIDPKTNATIVGTPVDDIDLKASVYLTQASVGRAAIKATTKVALGRLQDVEPNSKYGFQLAKLTTATLSEIILAGWREEQHDAKKAGFTLNQLDRAVKAYYSEQ